MRKTISLTMCLSGLILMTACGQQKDVPTAVNNAFKSKFTTAKKVKWDKENEKEWEAEFKMDGRNYSANFSNTGEWMETEYEIEIADLPEAVQSTINNEFSDYKIEEAEVSETSKGVAYEFGIEKDDHETEVVIDASGKVLKKETKEEGDDEDKD